MPGFLDTAAPSVGAEYARYIDADPLGKIIFKNILVNVLGICEQDIILPVGKHRDHGRPHRLPGDARVKCNDRWIDIEVKFSHLVSDKAKWNRQDAWAFSNCLFTSKAHRPKHYDLLFGIGILAPSVGADRYWESLLKLVESHKKSRRILNLKAFPHEPNFLLRCGMFCIPFDRIKSNGPKVAVRWITDNFYHDYFAWGYDRKRCRMIWSRATEGPLENGGEAAGYRHGESRIQPNLL